MLARCAREVASARSSEERYRILFNQSPKPVYAFDLETRSFVEVNEAALRHYGYLRHEFLSLTADGIRPPEEMRLMLERLSSGTQTSCLTRHRKKDGRLIDVEVSVQHLLIGDRMIALVFVNDVTDQKRAEQSLQEAHKSIAQSFDEIQRREADLRQLATLGEMLQSCHTLDEAYAIVSELLPRLFPDHCGSLFAMKASRDIVECVATWGGYDAKEGFFSPTECWALRRGRTHLAQSGTGPRCNHAESTAASALCIPMIAESDAMGVLHLSSCPDRASQPELPLSLQNLARAAADQIALALSNIRFRETLQNQSIRDPLTMLFNRRYMEESLERELHRAKRNQTSLAVVMLDIDHFKSFNDVYGHRAADHMLRLLGRFLQSSVRLDDIVCRYGGEEFVLILPGSALDDAAKRATQSLEGVRRIKIKTDGGIARNVSFSAGVAVFPQHGSDSDALLAAADRALYDAKHSGRNRISVAPENRPQLV